MIITGYERPLEEYSKNELVAIADRYKIYYESATGIGRMGGYSKLTKEKLIDLIKNDRDYQRDDPRGKRPPRNPKDPRDTINRSNRFHAYKESLKGNETPEEMMDEILRLAEGTERTIIQSGKYYTFVYYAKTPRIRYDRHPLIKGGVILPKGFNGFNFHWNKIRQYNSIPEESCLMSPIYEVTGSEFATLRRIPYRKIVQN